MIHAQIILIDWGKYQSQHINMPDWEQLITVGVADAWRVVKNEVNTSKSFILNAKSKVMNQFLKGGEGAFPRTSGCAPFAPS